MNIYKLYTAEYLKQLAKNRKAANQKFVKKLKTKKPKKLDALFLAQHTEKFNKINCLDCGNCCKTLGPKILDRDIERLAKVLHIKPSAFIAQYLKIDEDQDYVFKTMPCPFLAPDNYCLIYENRPKACREYPHTNHKKMLGKLNLALKNSETCPAVYLILEDLQKIPIQQIK